MLLLLDLSCCPLHGHSWTLSPQYAHDPWQLLVCCVLMSRVSSWATKHTAISGFFAKCPTPSDLLGAPRELPVLSTAVVLPSPFFHDYSLYLSYTSQDANQRDFSACLAAYCIQTGAHATF